MGRKPKEKRPLTDEEKAALKKQKAEYMKKYYRLHKERLLAAANNRYFLVSHGLVKENETARVKGNDSIIAWTRQLQEKLENATSPKVQVWLKSQIRWNNNYINGEETTQDMGQDQEDWQL